MDYEKKFLEIFEKNIQREGSEKVLDWLKKSDFFDAPASTNFHSAYRGGLCEHSVKAYERYVKLLASEYGEDWQKTISLESATIIALLHDICKVDFYKEEMRNVKVDGEWVQKPYYSVCDKLPYGHGEKSVYIINGFLKLTREEAMCINWHMGGFDARVKGGAYGLSDVFFTYPTATLFHIADVLSTYLDEKRGV